MATRITTALQNALADAVTSFVDADAGAGALTVRTGLQPVTANHPATGTVLVTIPLADPSFAAAMLGIATLDATPTLTALGVATGTAGWFRITDNSGDTVLDGAVTSLGGGGELELDSTTITSGVAVDIVAGTLTAPAST